MNGLKRTKLLKALTCFSLVLYLIALVAPTIARAQSQPASADREQRAVIDAYIETQMKELRIPDLALGIVRDDRVICSFTATKPMSPGQNGGVSYSVYGRVS
jgi:hypothetical protein